LGIPPLVVQHPSTMIIIASSVDFTEFSQNTIRTLSRRIAVFDLIGLILTYLTALMHFCFFAMNR
jgi:hypothetical protein